ncbi:hypothetical protein HMPREF0578_2310 [Mobiluncus mulieris 28-1]|nr:hypothetical protein HMPREF0578_2310 [Mobiluncus mulieris 28-1]
MNESGAMTIFTFRAFLLGVAVGGAVFWVCAQPPFQDRAH